MQAAIIVQGFPEERNGDRKIAFLDDRAAPDNLQQFVFVD
jgi:hypothetical protein